MNIIIIIKAVRSNKTLQNLTGLNVGSSNLSICAEVDTNEFSLLDQIFNQTLLDRNIY